MKQRNRQKGLFIFGLFQNDLGEDKCGDVCFGFGVDNLYQATLPDNIGDLTERYVCT